MKLLAFFMTFIMLLTGFDLCNDGNSIECQEKVELSGLEKDSHSEKDLCSPFCNCSRCPFSVLLPVVTAVFITERPAFQKQILSRSGIPSPIGTTVWQPPKSA